MAAGSKHYFRNGKEYKGAVHKMSNGELHTGKTHTKSSKRVFHFKDLSDRAKKVARSQVHIHGQSRIYEMVGDLPSRLPKTQR